jgi:hypothetical protein
MIEFALPQWLHVALDIVLGGVAGSVATIYFTRRQERTQVALDIIREYRALYGEVAAVLWLLRSSPDLDLSENQNRVKAMGNWYDIVSALWLMGEANRRLLSRVEINKAARNFRQQAMKASDGQEWLKEALEKWGDLAKLAAKQGGS